LDQGGNEASDSVVGMDRRLRIKLLHRVDDRRRVLDGFSVRRYHQGDKRHPGMFFVFRLAVGIPQNPLMRNAFVAKIGAHFYRIGRHLGAEDAIAVRHGLSSNLSFLTAYRPFYSGMIYIIKNTGSNEQGYGWGWRTASHVVGLSR